jgi:hypothetical protein
MANERIPNDPDLSPDDPYRTERADDQLRRAQRLDNDLQIDPELAEGPASSGRIALFAVAVAVILGAVFYGLNNSTINHAGTASTAQNTPASPPAAPPGARDVTPQGVTTGAAPARQQMPPPSSAPTGTEVNRAGNPPTTNAPGK